MAKVTFAERPSQTPEQKTRDSQRDALDSAAKAQFAAIERHLEANPHLRKEMAGFNLPRAADGVPKGMAAADFQALIKRMTAVGDKFQIPGAMSGVRKPRTVAPAVAPAPPPSRASTLPRNSVTPPAAKASPLDALGPETAAQMEARTDAGQTAAMDAQGLVQDANKAKPLGQDEMNERSAKVQDAVAGRTETPAPAQRDPFSSLSPDAAARAGRIRAQLVSEGRITQAGAVIPRTPKADPFAGATYTPTAGGGISMTSPYGTGSRKGTPSAAPKSPVDALAPKEPLFKPTSPDEVIDPMQKYALEHKSERTPGEVMFQNMLNDETAKQMPAQRAGANTADPNSVASQAISAASAVANKPMPATGAANQAGTGGSPIDALATPETEEEKKRRLSLTPSRTYSPLTPR